MRCGRIARRVDEARALVRFWDASAIIPLLIDEPTRAPCSSSSRKTLRCLLGGERRLKSCPRWGDANARSYSWLRRLKPLLRTAHQLADSWHEIVPSASVRRTAERLLRAHPLRAADSLQLAAALVAADHDPTTLELVCLDARLATVRPARGIQSDRRVRKSDTCRAAIRSSHSD